MSAKTAISILTEFCAKKKIAAPQFTPVIDNNSSLFSFDVKANHLKATGKGRTKQEAKQAASQLLIGIYPIQIY